MQVLEQCSALLTNYETYKFLNRLKLRQDRDSQGSLTSSDSTFVSANAPSANVPVQAKSQSQAIPSTQRTHSQSLQSVTPQAVPQRGSAHHTLLIEPSNLIGSRYLRYLDPGGLGGSKKIKEPHFPEDRSRQSRVSGSLDLAQSLALPSVHLESNDTDPLQSRYNSTAALIHSSCTRCSDLISLSSRLREQERANFKVKAKANKAGTKEKGKEEEHKSRRSTPVISHSSSSEHSSPSSTPSPKRLRRRRRNSSNSTPVLSLGPGSLVSSPSTPSRTPDLKVSHSLSTTSLSQTNQLKPTPKGDPIDARLLSLRGALEVELPRLRPSHYLQLLNQLPLSAGEAQLAFIDPRSDLLQDASNTPSGPRPVGAGTAAGPSEQELTRIAELVAAKFSELVQQGQGQELDPSASTSLLYVPKVVEENEV